MGAGERQRVSGRGRERERGQEGGEPGEGRTEGVSKGGGRRETGLPSMENSVGQTQSSHWRHEDT